MNLRSCAAIAQLPNPGTIPGSYIRRVFRHPLFHYLLKEAAMSNEDVKAILDGLQYNNQYPDKLRRGAHHE